MWIDLLMILIVVVPPLELKDIMHMILPVLMCAYFLLLLLTPLKVFYGSNLQPPFSPAYEEFVLIEEDV